MFLCSRVKADSREFKNDMDALYAVVSENFVWRYHDGISAERVLTGRDAIQEHIAGGAKARPELAGA
jgi:hypothetical protein